MAAALHSRHVPNDCSYPEYLEGSTNPPAAQPATEAEHHSVCVCVGEQLKALSRVENTGLEATQRPVTLLSLGQWEKAFWPCR